MSSILTPEELWNRLISLGSDGFYKMTPDLHMLREAYRRNRRRIESQAARKSFESALENWTVDQMREFLLEWLSEPGQLVGVETASLDGLRDFLRQVYNYIFE